MHQSNEQAALVGQQGKPESYYFPPQLNCDRQQFPVHLLRPGAGHDQGRHPPLPGALERGRQRHPQLQQGLSPEARHRLAGAAVRPARARLAGHLRAAVGLRRLRHVPVAGRGPAGALGACWSRTCPRRSTTTSTTSSSSSTGRATSIPSFKDHHYLEPIPVADTASGGLRRPLDRLRQGRRRAALHAPRS